MSVFPPNEPDSFDFFVSRRGSAKRIALEVVQILKDAGYTVRSQDHDIKSGDDFVNQMNKFVQECRNCVAILTRDYFDDDGWAKDEWNAFKSITHESGRQRRLIPLRVDDFQVDGINRTTVYVDLVGVSKARRRKVILDAVASVHAPPPRAGRSPAPTMSDLFGVPPRNAVFVGRAKLLEQLHQTLARKNVSRVAVQGLGGVGKTSLATEYAYRYGGEYAGVWWALARSRNELVESLAQLDAALDHQQPAGVATPQQNPEERAKSALRKLAVCKTPWLVIYDNVEGPKAVREFYPMAGARLLITTRRAKWGQQAIDFRVDSLDEFDGSQLLLKLTNLRDTGGAVRLAKVLGYLPLALNHAAAYVHDAGITFDQYAERVDRLIEKPVEEDSESVAKTFELAIERATGNSPAALKLLSFLSMLGAEHIPRDLVDDSIVPFEQLDDAMMALASMSLVQYEELDNGSRGINVHRLVQNATRRELGSKGAEEALKAAIVRLSKAFPKESYNDRTRWPLCKQLLPHVLALRDNARKAKVESEELALLLDSAANYQLTLSSFAESESLLKESIAVAERVLGVEHDFVGKLLYDLGNLYLNSGRDELAKKRYNEAVAIRIQKLARDDPWFALPLSNLGYASMRLGAFKRAEGYYRQALDAAGEPKGTRNFQVAGTLHKYGYMFWLTKRYDQAERRMREAIAMGKAVKADSVRIYDWQADLAGVLSDAGRLDEGERLYRDAIKRLDSIVGDVHSATSWARLGYARFLLKAERLEDARAVATRAVEVQTKLFGSGHRWTREATGVLDDIIEAQGKHAEPARAPVKRRASRRASKAS